MKIYRRALPQLAEAVRGDFYALRQVLGSYKHYPHQVIASGEWKLIQETAKYLRVENETLPHFELNSQSYTHFTSPMRRYFDLVVHRMVSSMILGSRRSPYSAEEINEICFSSTCKENAVLKFEERMVELQSCKVDDGDSIVVYGIARHPTENDKLVTFFILNPTNKAFREVYQLNLNLSALNLTLKPDIDIKNHVLKLVWKLRMYDMMGLHNVSPEEPATVSMDINVWRNVLGNLAAQNIPAVKAILQEFLYQAGLNQAQIPENQDTEFEDDLNSNFVVKQHYQFITLSLSSESILELQLLLCRFQTPAIHLVRVRRDLTICTEHNSKAILCFSRPSVRKASKSRYGNPIDYGDSWYPSISMEAAYNAIEEGDRAFLHNVPVRWQNERFENPMPVFSLTENFCKRYHITMSSGDYVCLKVKQDNSAEWVGHYLVKNVREKTDECSCEVTLRLNQTLLKPPDLFHTQGRCNIEWISKSVSARRMASSVWKVKEGETSKLARQIALGEKTATKPLPPSQEILGEIRGLSEPNQGQTRAIRMALSHRFSIIQGPPGTGKTVTGVRLAVLFSKLNRKLAPKATTAGGPAVKPQVLYCGPSNKSVDVVAEYFVRKLQNKKNSPKILRVYGEMVENIDFPIPGTPVPPRWESSTTKPTSNELLEPITLHRKIRSNEYPQADEIKERDEKFKRFFERSVPVTYQYVERYKALLMEAYKHFISKAEIIFCTCSAAASEKLTKSTNIKQVILDEAAMCSEPESMIPIVHAKDADHIVLIGDHMQLQPIVKALPAKKLGLDISLFQRYADNQLAEHTMLDQQYRMHKAIQAFPSAQFYNKKLKETTREQRQSSSFSNVWPGGKECPVAFCHVEGKEVSLPVSTAEGSEESKSNLAEVEEIVRYAKYLVCELKQKASQVVILSFYRSQCTEIQRRLAELAKCQHKPDTEDVKSQDHQKCAGNAECGQIRVFTVVKSQGSEWDYVLLSTVRSQPVENFREFPSKNWQHRHIGISSDPHQINVAITRARKGLIIVGNKLLLNENKTWHKLLKHYREKRAVVEAAHFMAGKQFLPVGMQVPHHD